MARQGITEAQIREAITQLELEGVAITSLKIRECLGTGSYSTISAVLKEWRDEQAAAQKLDIPEIPVEVRALFQKVWVEAWASAYGQYEVERQSYVEERREFEAQRQEMAGEITRLEEVVTSQVQELEVLQVTLSQAQEEKQAATLEVVRLEARVTSLNQEVERIRGDQSRHSEQLAEWIERATKAESELRQLKG